MNFFGSEWIVIPGIGACSFIITYVNADRIIAWMKEQSLGNREYVIKKLDEMFVEINKRRVTGAMLMASFGLGFLTFLIFWPHFTPGIIAGCGVTFVGWKLPKMFVNWYYERRCGRFVDQMVDALTLMSNGLKSNLSMPMALKLVVDNMPNPISQEFELMLSQNALGVALEEVLNSLAVRIPYPDVQMFVTAVNILKDTGGNIAETFETIALTIRERSKVEKKIAAVTAQGVMQGIILTAVPFILMGSFLIIDPDYMKPLFSTTLGLLILLGMLTLQIIGGLWIRKIVKIRV